MHLDTQELEGEPLRVQEPDRVIGLRLTRTIAERIAADRFRKNTHTPFSGKDVLYPFVVVEAKREKGPVAGFSGIEHQSAFPIRTCLRLQQNLQQETGIDLQCLVWFFAFRGEEWRVYGAAPDGDKTVCPPYCLPFTSLLVSKLMSGTADFRFVAWHNPLRRRSIAAMPDC